MFIFSKTLAPKMAGATTTEFKLAEVLAWEQYYQRAEA